MMLGMAVTLSQNEISARAAKFAENWKDTAREEAEAQALNRWVESLPEPFAAEMAALYAEMEARETVEAKIYKALDGLEALIQHNESDLSTWLPLEYDLQQVYAFDRVEFSSCLKTLRQEVLKDTLEKIEEGSRKEG